MMAFYALTHTLLRMLTKNRDIFFKFHSKRVTSICIMMPHHCNLILTQLKELQIED
jgi:hypothetical protein